MKHGFNYEDDHREEICEWLRQNGADPNAIPARSTVTLADGVITFPVYVKNERGNLVIDPSTRQPLRDVDSRPLVVEPNEIVRAWLAPRCPTCGR